MRSLLYSFIYRWIKHSLPDISIKKAYGNSTLCLYISMDKHSIPDMSMNKAYENSTLYLYISMDKHSIRLYITL